MEQIEKDVLTIISQRGPITSPAIRRYLWTEKLTDIKLRQIIKELNHQGYPIVSGDKGFWMAKTPMEVQEYIDSLEARIVGIRQRIGFLKSIKFTGQGELF